jgi:uncharacterized membrane protein
MRIRVPLILSLLLIAVMLGFSAFGWLELPDNTRIPVHFDINGVANRFGDKGQGLLSLPIVALFLTVVLAVVPRFEPRRLNLASSWKFYCVAWVGAIAVLAVTHALIVMGSLHMATDGPRSIPVILGILFAVIGNYLGKTRSNFIAGIRTPWTLSSDYSWEKTHRLTGRLLVLAGILTVAASLALSMKVAAEILLATMLSAVLTGVVASYVYWRRDPARHSADSVPG